MSDETAAEPTPESTPQASPEPSPPQQDPSAPADAEKKDEETVAAAPAPESQADGVSTVGEPEPAAAPAEPAPAADPVGTEPQPVAPESGEPATSPVPEGEPALAVTPEEGPSGGDGTPGTELPGPSEAVDAPPKSEEKADEGESANAGSSNTQSAESAGEPLSSPEPSAPAEPAKSDEPIIAQVAPEGAPLYSGRADPSPPPDLGDQEALPHPALTGHNPGFIPGATESTQAFIPVPGVAAAAAVAAQAIADAGKSGGTGEGTKSDEVKPASTDAPAAAPASAGQEETAEPTQPSSDDTPPATPAVPTAAHVPCAFQDLTPDALDSLGDHDEDEVKVLQLELQGLANIALALVKRIESLSEKKSVPQPLEGLQSSAQDVVNKALDIFETDESDLSGFESASADLILDDLDAE